MYMCDSVGQRLQPEYTDAVKTNQQYLNIISDNKWASATDKHHNGTR